MRLESLENLFDRLIAYHDGIKPKDVTLEYIERQREKRINPFLPNEVLRRDGSIVVLTAEELNLLEEYTFARSKWITGSRTAS
jgi:hypothetical protein